MARMSHSRMKTYLDNNIQAFFELLKAGLWEKDARLSQFNEIDYSAIMLFNANNGAEISEILD